MRRSERAADPAVARALFTAAPFVQLASTNAEGQPVLRTLNAVVVEAPDTEPGWALAFHGSPIGEKIECMGRLAVVGCDRHVADIPSWFTSEARACPATTWYRSAQVHGRIEAVEGQEERAAVVQALMERFQPEGKYRPIRAEDPMYTAAVRGIAVFRVVPTRVSAKVSVGQDKPDEARDGMLRGLWRRGAAGDLAALEMALDAAPERWPTWLTGPEGARLHPHLGSHRHPEVRALLQHAEWNHVFTETEMAAALTGGAALVGVSAPRAGDAAGSSDGAGPGDGAGSGELIAVARAVADGGKFAWLADVYVREDWRRRGAGEAMVRLLLEHPAVRGCRRVLLRTRIAESFYTRLGFRTFSHEGDRPWMVREAPVG